MAQFSFDASQVAPDSGMLEPIPEGRYKISMVDSEIKTTRSGTGLILAAKFNVVGGENNGYSVYTNFNIKNDNPKAQQIGLSQLSAVCHAVGIMHMQDSSQLHNRVLEAYIKVEKGQAKPDGSGFYNDRNVIAAYYKMESAKPSKAPIAPPKESTMKIPAWAEANPVQSESSTPTVDTLGEVPPWMQ